MIIGCGEALIDMVPAVTPAENGGLSAYLPCVGGSPYNTIVAVGRLGVPAAFLGRLSTDFFGEALVSHLEKNNVQTRLIRRTNETTTLAFVKLEAGCEPRYIFYTAGAADRSFSENDLPAKMPEDLRCIFFGSISMTMEPGVWRFPDLPRCDAVVLPVSFLWRNMPMDETVFGARFASENGMT
jgi:fructokinase